MGLIKENLALLEQEEDYWFSRCHEQWLLNGDNNTSYFHKIANGRRKMTIVSLENDVVVIEGDDNLLQHATDYYTNLLMTFTLTLTSGQNSLRCQLMRMLNFANPFLKMRLRMLFFKWKQIKQLAQIKFLLNSIKHVGMWLKQISNNYLMIFMLKKLVLAGSMWYYHSTTKKIDASIIQ
jgi:hypothetical protein